VLHISAAVGESMPMSSMRMPNAPMSQPGMMAMDINTTVVGSGVSGSLAAIGAGMMDRHPGEETVVTEAIAALPETPLDVHPVTLPEALESGLVMITDPYSFRADAYRALRHRLSSQGDPKIIGVTSAVGREGKTTAAINLAAALREGARGRVLLVEANMRAPAVADRLGFQPPECFAQQLARHRTDPLEPWVAVEPFSPFHVMAVDPTSTRLPILDPIAFSIAMDRLRLAGYDYIVVDTPPVLGSADVNMIADSVDAMILTARTRRSTTSEVKRAIDQVGSLTFAGTLLLDA